MGEKSELTKALIVGCIDPEAKLEIAQSIQMRIASGDLDPQGNKAKFLMQIIEEMDQMESCDITLEQEPLTE